MISAVLFDLDGTLLDIDLNGFLGDYFALLGPVIAELLGTQDPRFGLDAVLRGTEAMASHHPGRTNREVFNSVFSELAGIDLGEGAASLRLERFYAESFPTLRAQHGPRPGAPQAVAACRARGLKVALATNPIFPLAAIEERARWAGFTTASFDAVTSYETSHACKPSASYFLEVAERLGVAAGECLMVGDDRDLDLPASAAGMKTFYVGSGAGDGADWMGDLEHLVAHLDEMAN